MDVDLVTSFFKAKKIKKYKKEQEKKKKKRKRVRMEKKTKKSKKKKKKMKKSSLHFFRICPREIDSYHYQLLRSESRNTKKDKHMQLSDKVPLKNKGSGAFL